MSFYAEHLPRIGSVSVIIESNDSKVLVKNVDPNQLTVQDGDDSKITINLPCEVQVDNTPQLSYQGKDCVIRLKAKINSSNVYLDRASNFMVAFSHRSKWNKSDLSKGFEFECSECGAVLLSKFEFNRVLDMPSEFWAEFMDYWHCHKPHIDSKAHTDYKTKYNSLKPKEGELLVGDSFLLLDKNWFPERFPLQTAAPTCFKCLKPLGEVTADHLLKIYKWNLILRSAEGHAENYCIEYSVVSSLMNIINSHAARIINLKDGTGAITVLWVFGIGIDVTLLDNTIIKGSLKILYVSDPAEGSIDDIHGRQQADSLTVSETCYKAFLESLETTRNKLPIRHRSIEKWHVSYISSS
ncbi:HEL313Wp [Eremothecium sinecaudum]|uniref:HEL313Wp n=1 Tax=Eremothecium sinecaudum TaxID=45286 RepID=A0A109UZ49_9SACH|nr:HEL313Wp [Eremothecium sinecaudum]AMD20968.1 HEL313Wp [Eremothecium sinecaudum]